MKNETGNGDQTGAKPQGPADKTQAANAVAERNAATAVAGEVIFNTTAGKLQVYDGGNWLDLH